MIPIGSDGEQVDNHGLGMKGYMASSGQWTVDPEDSRSKVYVDTVLMFDDV